MSKTNDLLDNNRAYAAVGMTPGKSAPVPAPTDVVGAPEDDGLIEGEVAPEPAAQAA